MRSVHKSVLVPYSAQQMFDLVERVEDYPKFLPWCGGTRILQRTAEHMLVRIDIDYRGVRAHFTTCNRNEPPDRIARPPADSAPLGGRVADAERRAARRGSAK